MPYNRLFRIRPHGANNAHLPANEQQNLRSLEAWEDIDFFRDKVALPLNDYRLIFGIPSAENRKPSQRGIVKIKYIGNDHESRVIYRLFHGERDLDNGSFALTKNSMKELNAPAGVGEYELTKSKLFGKFTFYWNNPFHEVRVAFKLGVIMGSLSVTLGLLSVFITIVLS